MLFRSRLTFLRNTVTVHSVPVTDKNPCKNCKTNKFVAQMDFYLLYIRFRTDLAVNAKSCVNSNVILYFRRTLNFLLSTS